MKDELENWVEAFPTLFYSEMQNRTSSTKTFSFLLSMKIFDESSGAAHVTASSCYLKSVKALLSQENNLRNVFKHFEGMWSSSLLICFINGLRLFCFEIIIFKINDLR